MISRLTTFHGRPLAALVLIAALLAISGPPLAQNEPPQQPDKVEQESAAGSLS